MNCTWFVYKLFIILIRIRVLNLYKKYVSEFESKIARKNKDLVVSIDNFENKIFDDENFVVKNYPNVWNDFNYLSKYEKKDLIKDKKNFLKDNLIKKKAFI